MESLFDDDTLDSPYEEGVKCFSDGDGSEMVNIFYVRFSKSWETFIEGWIDASKGISGV
jgi:hypothetical protein